MIASSSAEVEDVFGLLLLSFFKRCKKKQHNNTERISYNIQLVNCLIHIFNAFDTKQSAGI